MMCLSDRSTLTSALSDHSTFTSTDVRVTDLYHCFFGGLVVVWGCGCLQELKLSPPLSFQVMAYIFVRMDPTPMILSEPKTCK
jgi:hypothetical protein